MNDFHLASKVTPRGYHRCPDCCAFARSQHGLNRHRKEKHGAEHGRAPPRFPGAVAQARLDASHEEGEEEEFLPGEAPAPLPHGPPRAPSDTLIEYFTSDLSLFNHAWIPVFGRISNNLLLEMQSPDLATALTATTALFILPGVVSNRRKARALTGDPRFARVDSPISALRFFDGAEDKAGLICDFASYIIATAAVPSIRRARGDVAAIRVDSLKKKAETACAMGRISVAARALAEMEPLLGGSGVAAANPPPLSAAARTQLIEELFPAANDDDDLDFHFDHDPAHVELTTDQVHSSLAGLKIDRAAGHSGWTNRLLRRLSTGGPTSAAATFIDRLTAVFNLLLAGEAPPAIRKIWFTSRLVFIPKDATAYRPIGIGETLYRALGSAVMRAHGPAIATRLQPHQLAVGVKGGVEIAAVMADLGYGDEETGTLSIDISNAFNSVRRKLMLAGLLEYFPDIIPFFKWCYGSPVDLRDNSGHVIGAAGSGCLQGDPLASLYFAVALQPVLLAIDAKLQEFATEAGKEDRPGFVVAISDDMMTQAPMPTLFRVAPIAVELLGNMGLRTNLGKSFALGVGAMALPNPPVGWTIKDDGGKTLGRPLGSREAQEAWIKTALAKQEPPSRALRVIGPQQAIMVLEKSYNHKFDYLHKVVVKGYGSQHFADHDALIDASLLAIAAAPTHAHLRDVRELPLNLGGLGMPSQTGITAMRHYLTTQRRTELFFEQYHQSLHPVLLNKFYRAEDDFALFTEMHEATYTQYVAIANDISSGSAMNQYTKAARIVAGEMLKARAEQLHATLAEDPFTQELAAQFLSCMAPHTGSWLRSSSLPLFGAGVPFSPDSFREMLRSRALILFNACYGDVPTQCPSCKFNPVNLTLRPMHPLICPGHQKLTKARHDHVRDRLAKLIKTVLPDGNTRMEPDNHLGVHLTRRPDIRFEENGESLYIDIVVAEPTAQSAMTHPDLSSINTPGGAALLAEERKRSEYDGHAQGINVVPFAVESTGRLGPAAQALLNRLCADEGKARILGAFNSDLSFILASAKGHRLSVCRSRLAAQEHT
jgi:hypothetical protein